MNGTKLQLLVLDSEPSAERAERRDSVGRSNGESYRDTLKMLEPSAACSIVNPASPGAHVPDGSALEGYDAVFLTGSPLHLYEESDETRRSVELMRAVFASGVPAFGSCAGLQVATVAAGGTVRPSARGREAAFARRITPTEAGREHPLLAGRPAAFDAPAIHTDEVEALPAGGTALAGNGVNDVQAAEIRFDGGVFWGVQYHPELPLDEIAAALRRQAEDLVAEGLATDREDVAVQADLIEALHRRPDRKDLAWRLGVDDQVTVAANRTRELRNFLDHLVKPTRTLRCRT